MQEYEPELVELTVQGNRIKEGTCGNLDKFRNEENAFSSSSFLHVDVEEVNIDDNMVKITFFQFMNKQTYKLTLVACRKPYDQI